MIPDPFQTLVVDIQQPIHNPGLVKRTQCMWFSATQLFTKADSKRLLSMSLQICDAYPKPTESSFVHSSFTWTMRRQVTRPKQSI